jgi:phosphoglycolate phosphatase-like HAD superfamily hydrolase
LRFEKRSIRLSCINEIRAFNDHISRCYRDGITDEEIDAQVAKALGHMERLALDCYKFLNIYCHDKTVKRFEKWTKKVDLSVVNNGEFYSRYKELYKNVTRNLKEAKRMEATNKDKSIELYQLAHNQYTDLETLFDDNHVHICRAKARFSVSKVAKFLLWLFATVISGIASSVFISWDKLWELLTGFFR